MASGTTVGGESARYCDTSIPASFYNAKRSLMFTDDDQIQGGYKYAGFNVKHQDDGPWRF